MVALLFCLGCASAQRGTIMRAQAAIDDSKYQVALNRLSYAESCAKPEPIVAARLYYMKGICYQGLHKPDEAKAMFKFVIDRYPDTDYGYMAKEKLSK